MIARIFPSLQPPIDLPDSDETVKNFVKGVRVLSRNSCADASAKTLL